MNKTSITGDIIEVFMRQLGAADVKMVNSTLYYIEFRLHNGVEVSYCYNINFKDQYFLQRIKPYPLSRGTFSTEEDIIDFITSDINQFYNAEKSSNFTLYLDIANKLSMIGERSEELFLNYNVDSDHMRQMNRVLDIVMKRFDHIERESEKI